MELTNDSLEKKFFNKAVSYLAQRPHSSYELGKKLNAYWARILPEEDINKRDAAVEAAINRLTSLNYLNDNMYFRDLISSAASSPSPKSPAELKRYLYDRNVPLDVIESRLAELYTPDLERKALSTLISKSHKRYSDTQKLISYLIGKGYKYTLIADLIDR